MSAFQCQTELYKFGLNAQIGIISNANYLKPNKFWNSKAFSVCWSDCLTSSLNDHYFGSQCDHNVIGRIRSIEHSRRMCFSPINKSTAALLFVNKLCSQSSPTQALASRNCSRLSIRRCLCEEFALRSSSVHFKSKNFNSFQLQVNF